MVGRTPSRQRIRRSIGLCTVVRGDEFELEARNAIAAPSHGTFKSRFTGNGEGGLVTRP